MGSTYSPEPQEARAVFTPTFDLTTDACAALPWHDRIAGYQAETSGRVLGTYAPSEYAAATGRAYMEIRDGRAARTRVIYRDGSMEG